MSDENASKLEQFKNDAKKFIEETDPEFQDPSRQTPMHRMVNFWVMVGKSFVRNRCLVRASALAYTTLLALIPMLAVGISVTVSLLKQQGEKPIREIIDRFVAYVAPALELEVKADGMGATGGRAEVVTKIADFISNIQSGTLGVTSVFALMFVAISLLRTIEATFNDIWGVTRGRTWVSSIVTYWAVITLGPIVLVLATGLSTGPLFTKTQAFLSSAPILGGVLFSLLPFLILSLGFGLFYQFMPNTRVPFSAAMAGGLVAGFLWEVNSVCNTLYASNVVTYSKIYGSLGLVPLFLLGLYFSWMFLLFGAQVAYAFQNRASYAQEKLSEGVHQRGKEFIAVRLMTLVAKNFSTGAKPPTCSRLAKELSVPTRLCSAILTELIRAKLLVEVADVETAYTPARPLEQITLSDVIQALRTGKGLELETADDTLRPVVREELRRVQAAEETAGRAITLSGMIKQEKSVAS